jgi:hypothetical protein
MESAPRLSGKSLSVINIRRFSLAVPREPESMGFGSLRLRLPTTDKMDRGN